MRTGKRASLLRIAALQEVVPHGQHLLGDLGFLSVQRNFILQVGLHIHRHGIGLLPTLLAIAECPTIF